MRLQSTENELCSKFREAKFKQESEEIELTPFILVCIALEPIRGVRSTRTGNANCAPIEFPNYQEFINEYKRS